MNEPVSSSVEPTAIYARVSDYKQLGERFGSIDAQLQVCRSLLKNFPELIEEEAFVDPAYSGKNLRRPGMDAMMRAIASGRIKVVVAYKIERLLRSGDEWPEFRRFLQQHHCRLISVVEGMVQDTAAGRFHSSMLVNMAAYERENTAEKVSNKLHLQAQLGIWNGGMVPYGYDYDRTKKRLFPHKVEARIVARIFEQVAALVPLAKIVTQLCEEGVRTRVRTFRNRQGQTRTAGGVRPRIDWLRLLIGNPRYRGVVRSRGREFKGQHEALVSPELWERANAAIRPTEKPIRRCHPTRDRHGNVLKGLVFCGHCDRAMVPHASGKLDSKGKPYRFYSCNRVLKERGDARCPVRHVSGPMLEAGVISLLGRMARHPQLVAAALAAGRPKAQSQLEAAEKKLRALDREITQRTGQLTNIVDALAKGGLAVIDGDLRARVEELQRSKEALLVERERLQQERDALRQEQMAPEKVCAALEKFDALWLHMTPDEQRELVALLIARVEVRVSKKAETTDGGPREFQLTIRLHLPELLSADGSSTSEGKQRVLALDARVQLPAKANGEIVITAPFKHRVEAKNATKAEKQPAPWEHPLHRALRWSRMLSGHSGNHLNGRRVSLRKLAKHEKVSPAAVSRILGLLRLVPAIQQRLLALTDRRVAWHLGLTPMERIARLPKAEQIREFEKLWAERTAARQAHVT